MQIISLNNIFKQEFEKLTIWRNSFHENGFIPMPAALFFSSSVKEVKHTKAANTTKLSRMPSDGAEHNLFSHSYFSAVEQIYNQDLVAANASTFV
jgi:hypothetical protein